MSAELPTNIGPNAFAGTAEYYARYRPPYPEALLDDLLGRVARRGRLLDLACGPGRIALQLAARFESVLAVDSEPEMLEVGERLAKERDIENVTWRCARAEDLAVEPAALDLITVGEAFHRLDQRVVLDRAKRWLRPGGCIASIGSRGILQGLEPWQRAVAALARTWTSDAFPDGWATSAPGAATGPAAEAEAMRSAGFADVESRTFLVDHAWTIEEVAGYLRTTSVCSRRILGGRQAAFEAALRDLLLAIQPVGELREQLDFGHTVGRRPD